MLSFLNKLMGPSNVNHLGGPEFKKQFAETKGAVLLDVRTPAEFKSGHIAGAKNIDFTAANFADQVKKLDPDKAYFVYCRSGNRSGQACALMATQGLTAYNLAGGIGAWPR